MGTDFNVCESLLSSSMCKPIFRTPNLSSFGLRWSAAAASEDALIDTRVEDFSDAIAAADVDDAKDGTSEGERERGHPE